MAEQNLGNHDFGVKIPNGNGLARNTNNEHKSNRCTMCDYVSSQANNLLRHQKTHSEEKSNKCSQCDFVCSYVGNLKRHMKTHSSAKQNKAA